MFSGGCLQVSEALARLFTANIDLRASVYKASHIVSGNFLYRYLDDNAAYT
jgi:hypothetical protein